jgi:prolyl oligopeptidase
MTQSADALSVYALNINGPFELLSNIKMPGRGTITIQTGEKNEDDVFLFEYSSYTSPVSFYSLNLHSYYLEQFWFNKQLLEKSGYKEDLFTSDYTQYKSKDGTIVPMTIIRKKSVLPTLDTVPDKPILTHLYGYGGFGTNNKPEFDMNDIVFYNNFEGIKVIAHIRGGGELGNLWHQAGKQEKR